MGGTRRRVGLAFVIAGLILVLVPVAQYAHARIYYELVNRGIITLASDPALDTSSLPPVTEPPTGGTSGTTPPGGNPGDPSQGGSTPGGGGTSSGGTPSGSGTSGSGSTGTTPPSGGSTTPTTPTTPTAPTEPIWRIVIPKIKVNRSLAFGVTEETLKLGPGVYPQGAQPGESGNLAIAGHRNAYGSPFWYLDRLKPGDEVRITYGAKVWVYIVERLYVVEPTDWSVIAPTDHDAITLTTCHPLGSTAQRLIVRGILGWVIE